MSTKADEQKSLGQVAYEAWCESNYLNAEWDLLRSSERNAWHDVATAVYAELKKRPEQQ